MGSDPSILLIFQLLLLKNARFLALESIGFLQCLGDVVD